MSSLWKRLLALFQLATRSSSAAAHTASVERAASADVPALVERASETPGAAPAASAPPKTDFVPRAELEGSRAALPAAPRAAPERPSIANLDEALPLQVMLADWQENLLMRIGQRVESGSFQMPQMPASQMLAMNMASNPHVEIRELVEAITRDPVLSSDLLKLANSVRYATEVKVETLHAAVLRIGLRGLRALILSASMRGALLRTKDLNEFGTEVWRQAYSMATIAQALAGCMPMDPERAFVIGLLHDIGKVPLLSMLCEGIPHGKRANMALVGRAFSLYHEQAGVAMARSWNLTEELVAVIGRHHRFAENETHPREAAFACLVHKIDLQLSLGAEDEYWAIAQGEEFAAIGVPQEQRSRLLLTAKQAFDATHAAHAQLAA